MLSPAHARRLLCSLEMECQHARKRHPITGLGSVGVGLHCFSWTHGETVSTQGTVQCSFHEKCLCDTVSSIQTTLSRPIVHDGAPELSLLGFCLDGESAVSWTPKQCRVYVPLESATKWLDRTSVSRLRVGVNPFPPDGLSTGRGCPRVGLANSRNAVPFRIPKKTVL